jgi:hypothetical protein
MRLLTTILGVLFSCGVLPGCGQATSKPAAGVARVTFCDYAFEFDMDRPLSVDGHRNSVRDSSGSETQLDEDITFKYGNVTARIVDGKLTVDGKEHGSVKPGDCFKLESSGSLSINGAQK